MSTNVMWVRVSMLPEEKLETFIVALLFLSRLEAWEACTLKNLHFFSFHL